MHKPTARRPADQLSTCEREVLWLLAEGHTATAVATKLSLSPSAVETHRTEAMRKLALRTEAELVRYVLQRAVQADQGSAGK